MVSSSTITITSDWKKKETLAAHNSLKELWKPNKLNDLIMTKVNLMVEKVSQHCDATEVRVDVTILIGLIQIRKLRDRIEM